MINSPSPTASPMASMVSMASKLGAAGGGGCPPTGLALGSNPSSCLHVMRTNGWAAAAAAAATPDLSSSNMAFRPAQPLGTAHHPHQVWILHIDMKNLLQKIDYQFLPRVYLQLVCRQLSSLCGFWLWLWRPLFNSHFLCNPVNEKISNAQWSEHRQKTIHSVSKSVYHHIMLHFIFLDTLN